VLIVRLAPEISPLIEQAPATVRPPLIVAVPLVDTVEQLILPDAVVTFPDMTAPVPLIFPVDVTDPAINAPLISAVGAVTLALNVPVPLTTTVFAVSPPDKSILAPDKRVDAVTVPAVSVPEAFTEAALTAPEKVPVPADSVFVTEVFGAVTVPVTVALPDVLSEVAVTAPDIVPAPVILSV